jgi:hypothetical protein
MRYEELKTMPATTHRTANKNSTAAREIRASAGSCKTITTTTKQ